jgi:hypothetical protein
LRLHAFIYLQEQQAPQARGLQECQELRSEEQRVQRAQPGLLEQHPAQQSPQVAQRAPLGKSFA